MSDKGKLGNTCVIIGASHAGVNLAFALRREGWEGRIILYDADPRLPYHRPPLSKTYLSSDDPIEKYSLKSADSYDKADISLQLGVRVTEVDPVGRTVKLENGTIQQYDRLVLATGARPLLPAIPGLDRAEQVFTLRTAKDVEQIRAALSNPHQQQVVIIGGGYIGLEIAASLRQLGTEVVVLEREARVLARVTAPETSHFFETLHAERGVAIHTDKNVNAIEKSEGKNVVLCSDGSRFPADIIIVGVGIRVNLELARAAGLKTDNGILVDTTTCTSDAHIYAIGDCTYHYNQHYDRYLRLECVQNAVDQAKVAAAAICGKQVSYNALPWFWSDQYNVKLQIAGISEGYDEAVTRREADDPVKFSIWYFKGDELLAVDAINNARAYVLGTKWIRAQKILDKTRLSDPGVNLKELG
jgi:3-phenylpropionate/trans-cinnamate dioxygenase ferredoxin reductase subunit